MKDIDNNTTAYIQELEDKIVDLSLNLKNCNNKLTTFEKENHQRIRTIVHNLKNPIGVAGSFAEMIADSSENISKEKLDKYIDVIQKSTSFSIELLSSLSVLNTLISPDFKPNLQNTNYGEFLNGIINGIRKEESYKNSTITTNFPNKTITLSIDIHKIEIAIKNLLSNALRFSPNNAIINITIVEKESAIETIITDQGIGIAADNLANIFNEFYSVNTYCEYNNKCVGLGLNIVKRIVDYHHGKITVNSTLENGSNFVISIPK